MTSAWPMLIDAAMQDRLSKELVRDEGVRRFPYRDTVGKLTIGIGRNLDAKGLNASEIDLCFRNDVAEVVEGLDLRLPWWRSLNEVRARVLINMAFMGIGNTSHGLLSFTDTLAKMKAGDYAGAAASMRDSLWAKQVGARATRLAKQMETGK